MTTDFTTDLTTDSTIDLTADFTIDLVPEEWGGWCLADPRGGRWWPTEEATTEDALWAAFDRGEGAWCC